VIRISPTRHGEWLEGVVLVARDRASGFVHGTYAHSYLESETQKSHEAAAERWLADLRERLGRGADLEVTTLRFRDLSAGRSEQPFRRPAGRGAPHSEQGASAAEVDTIYQP
jgi:hypothetical protein